MLQVKLFDCEHEEDLQEEMNGFLSELDSKDVVDIQYRVAAFGEAEKEQIYCYSALILYKEK